MEARDYVKALLDKGMSQNQIQDRTGIPQASISKILHGEIKDVLSQRYRALQDLFAEIVEHRKLGRRTTPPEAASRKGPKPGHKRTVKARGAGQ